MLKITKGEFEINGVKNRIKKERSNKVWTAQHFGLVM